MTKNTGGPAFPEIGNIAHNSDWQNESGMTLRDWFAGQALLGILANPTVRQADKSMSGEEALARTAYAVADAMIKAR